MTKITKIGKLGLELIKSYEGFSSTSYTCPAGVATIGYGSTRYANGTKVTLQDKPITIKEAEQLLLDTLGQYERAVDAYTTDKVNQNQFDSLVSFAYNLGTSSLKKSTLLKKVNNDTQDPTIYKEFLKWVYADGRLLKGLQKRRTAEATLYFL